MGLFKDVKKPVIKATTGAGGEVSSARPTYAEKTPPCIAHCPNGGDVREWLVTIAQYEAYGRTRAQAFEAAWRTITENNPFPAIAARVCQHPCEQSCNRKAKDGAVGIHLLERFIGDYAIANGFKLAKPTVAAAGLPVAIVGAGPAGLSCAYHLARRGYAVTVFDAAPKPGGMMRYRVPRSVIPEAVLDAEIAKLTDFGVQVRGDCVVGRDVTLQELRHDYAAVFFAMGLQKTTQLELKREGEGGVLIGELPSDPPETIAETSETDRRVVNTISPAIAQGRWVADAIASFLQGKQEPKPVAPPAIKSDQMKLAWYPAAAPHVDIDPAVQLGISEEEAVAEAKRCMSCGMCMDCETCWMYCTRNCFVKLPKGEHYKIKLELCNGCKKCVDACPCGYINMN